jgi:hypothetical protein
MIERRIRRHRNANRPSSPTVLAAAADWDLVFPDSDSDLVLAVYWDRFPSRHLMLGPPAQ